MRYIRDMNESLRLRIDITKLSAHCAQALGLHRKKAVFSPQPLTFWPKQRNVADWQDFYWLKK
jgi:hypothetical protein